MASTLNTAILAFGVIFYSLTVIVFILRAYEKSDQELKLKYIFSLQIIPFTVLTTLSVYQNQIRKAITLVPMLVFLVYDYWYRIHAEMKPLHHPDKWPRELVVYIVLLYAGSIGLNWYGFLVSDQYGMILVVSFLFMMGAYSLYQYRHNKRKKQSSTNPPNR